MTDLNQNVDQAKDMLNLEQKDMNKLPQMLNVLTILTYIGCALAAIGALYTFFTISTSYKLIEGYRTMTDGLSGSENKAVQSLMSGSMEIVKKQYDNRMMIMILTLAGAALCFYGAMQMRNLKKQGYLIYVVGELIPTISYAIFIGFGSLFGGVGMIFTTLIAVVFIILYTTQKKSLIN
ncbi:MAG: hypothetical protein ABI685_09885 [Ferruginibacter sp.]